MSLRCLAPDQVSPVWALYDGWDTIVFRDFLLVVFAVWLVAAAVVTVGWLRERD